MAYSRTTWADYPSLTTPITAARLNNIEAMLASIANAGDAWTAYTPTWTGTGGTPSIGNGTLTGTYVQVGKTVHFFLAVVWGSTTTANTATAWVLSLPVAPAAPSSVSQIATASAYDSSVTTNYTGHAILNANGTISAIRIDNIATVAGATSPMTWATNDFLRITGTYEAA